jgi:hypothetical protein
MLKTISYSLTIAMTTALLAVALVPEDADARINIRVGIGDQNTTMFDNPLFQRANMRRTRYFIRWNAMNNEGERLRARHFVQRARQERVSVLIHVSTHNLDRRRGQRPSVARYRREMTRMVRYFRTLGVREFGAWNEVNHDSQPTHNSPGHAAAYFREMYRIVKGRCRSCIVVALDVLDQRGVERYMRTFYQRLSPTWRRRATVVGIHNYGDVNRNRIRTSFTRNIISMSRRYNRRSQFWFTETGGLVKFGNSWPCHQTRAANRLRNVFRLARTYRSAGVRRIYLYNWTGAGCDARFDAGLTNPDGSARPAYNRLRAILPNYMR